ncbi:hypothetical protein GGD41_006894 [Paraburkholderia bryophila]|uniref:Uncharacterized protein n=1 Tax=Paraburkholderia bryophila TaxID=420952 RepID=A0A7Y9WGB0_9BURK|nr:hypothetical protein [Paraburkholderia bryophila]
MNTITKAAINLAAIKKAARKVAGYIACAAAVAVVAACHGPAGEDRRNGNVEQQQIIYGGERRLERW